MAVVKGKYFFKVETNYFYSQRNYSPPRTAIEAEIHFQALYVHVQRLNTSLTKCQTRYCMEPRPSVDDCKVMRFLGAVIKPVHPCTGLIARFAEQNALLLKTTDIRVGTEKKTPREQSSSGKKIGVVWCSGADRRSFEASAVPILLYLYIVLMVHKYRQSAKERCLLKRKTVPEVFPLTIGSGKTKPFEKRHAGCEEREKINRRRIYDTLRINFFEATKQTACIFSKGDKNNPQGLRVHKHIFVGNSRLVTAMTHTDNNGDNAEQREKRYYYHSDHLGSAQFVTDWSGRQYEHIEYTPYGELWIEEVAAGLDKLPFRFTGKEMDEETGLYYYGARYLDPKYSRWISTDPALSEYMAGSSVGAGGIYNTVNFNVYHYGNNNPIKYTDPTGMWIDNGDGTYTAEKGDTLWDKYGADWKEKSGFTRDPRTLQVGETVGEKNIPTYSDASAEMKQQIPQGNAQDSNQNVVASKKSNDVAFSYGFGGKLALVLGLGAESGFIGDTSGNLYWYLSGSVGCGIQTPSTTKTDLSTLQYLKSAKGFSGGVSLDPTQVGKSSSLTADICLGVTGTYDLNNQKSSGLPNSWGFGSVGGGVWKTGTIVVPIYKKER